MGDSLGILLKFSAPTVNYFVNKAVRLSSLFFL